MRNNIHPYPGIHNKVLNKTRIVRRFIWWLRLNKKWKFFTTACILQKCLRNQYAIGLNNPTKKDLDWYDVEYINEPTTFLKCDCGNELTTSGSFVSETAEGVTYECTDCQALSLWDFDSAPVAIQIKPNIKDITEFV
jgi:hypothetical protein